MVATPILEAVIVFLLFLAFGGLIVSFRAAGSQAKRDDKKEGKKVLHELKNLV